MEAHHFPREADKTALAVSHRQRSFPEGEDGGESAAQSACTVKTDHVRSPVVEDGTVAIPPTFDRP